MRAYLETVGLALVACALATPVVRHIAVRMRALSYPGGRHVHQAAVPRMGGAAIYFALVTAVFVLSRLDATVREALAHQAPQTFGLFFGATAMVTLGLVDDARGLKAHHKLIGQVVVATGAFWFGFRLQNIWVPWFGSLPMGIFGLPVTVLWIVGIVNAINLIDGLDGLAAGIVLFAAATNFVVALLSGSVFIALIMAAMIGALLGFLLFNFNPARIFMGDSGSYLLGYVLATSALVGSQKTSTAVSLLVPCLALGVPIFDTLFSILRRFLEKRSIFSPDRGHIHHRLLDVGLTHRRAVLTMYAVSAVFSVTAIAVWLGNQWQEGIALLVASVVLFALIRFAGYVEYVQGTLRRRARTRSPLVEALRNVLPELPLRLRDVAAEGDVFEGIACVAPAMGLQRVDLRGKTMSIRPIWEAPAASSRDDDATTLLVPVGREDTAQATLGFTFTRADAGAESEILLVLLADMVAAALTAVGSPLAPRPVEMRAVQDSDPVHDGLPVGERPSHT